MQNFVAKTNSIVGNMKATDNAWSKNLYMGERLKPKYGLFVDRAVFTWLSKGIGFGFGFGFTTPFGWLVYLLWFWFYDSQVKTALLYNTAI